MLLLNHRMVLDMVLDAVRGAEFASFSKDRCLTLEVSDPDTIYNVFSWLCLSVLF